MPRYLGRPAAGCPNAGSIRMVAVMPVRPHPAPRRRQGPDKRFRSGQVVFERPRSRLAAGVPGTGEEIRAGEVAAVGDIGPVRACVDAHRRPAVAGARGNPDWRGGQFLARFTL